MVSAERSEDIADAAGPSHREDGWRHCAHANKSNNEQWRCFRFRLRQLDRVTNTPAVQPTAQRQTPTIKKILKTVEILHVVQRQCPPSRRSGTSLSYRSWMRLWTCALRRTADVCDSDTESNLATKVATKRFAQAVAEPIKARLENLQATRRDRHEVRRKEEGCLRQKGHDDEEEGCLHQRG